jgi:hypothetical protein
MTEFWRVRAMACGVLSMLRGLPVLAGGHPLSIEPTA